jgi:hypothetical protein
MPGMLILLASSCNLQRPSQKHVTGSAYIRGMRRERWRDAAHRPGKDLVDEWWAAQEDEEFFRMQVKENHFLTSTELLASH